MVKRIQREGRERLLGVTKALTKSKVSVGFHKDDGIHADSGMSYASLMYLLEVKGVRSTSGLTRRRAFELTVKMHRKELLAKNNQRIKSAYLMNIRNPENIIGFFGEELAKRIKETFGNTGVLPGNSPNTIRIKGRNEPLVDTGALRDKLSYRVTDK